VLCQGFRINGVQRFRGGHEPIDHLWRDCVGLGRGMAAENVVTGAAPRGWRVFK
jgi:hypothetical protein